MADPLSIAASITGTTVAGTQAIYKLNALASKVATANDRVTSIANDIGSTSAILRDVRDLIAPQGNTNDSFTSIFSETALINIADIVRTCADAFSKIDTYQTDAYRQVQWPCQGRDKIELSKLERLKWPFLQQEFADLRDDLKTAKINLMLMIAVAHLAFTSNGNQTRQLSAREQEELKYTIFELDKVTGTQTRGRANGSGQAGGTFKRLLHGLKRSTPPSIANQVGDSTANTSSASVAARSLQAPNVSNSRPQIGAPGFHETPIRMAVLSPQNDDHACEASSSSANDVDGIAIPTATASAANTAQPSSVTVGSMHVTNVSCAVRLRSIADCEDGTLSAWVTEALAGLSTGLDPALNIHALEMSQSALQGLLKERKQASQSLPDEALLKLNTYQRDTVQRHVTQKQSRLLYVGIWHSDTITSVFGSLGIEVLLWILFTPGVDKPIWNPKPPLLRPDQSVLNQTHGVALDSDQMANEQSHFGSRRPYGHPTMASLRRKTSSKGRLLARPFSISIMSERRRGWQTEQETTRNMETRVNRLLEAWTKQN